MAALRAVYSAVWKAGLWDEPLVDKSVVPLAVPSAVLMADSWAEYSDGFLAVTKAVYSAVWKAGQWAEPLVDKSVVPSAAMMADS